MDSKNLNIPKEFDLAFYKTCKQYLKLDDKEIEKEFLLYGIPSGTPGSSFCYKENIINFFYEKRPILEIGPGSRPAFSGDDVFYCDVLNSEELLVRARKQNQPIDLTPKKIHYHPRDLENVELKNKFDLVYSAHVIEHQLNIIEHFKAISDVLKDGGLYVAIVPNKNFTFDYFREVSTLEDILSDEFKKEKHTLRTILQSLNRAHNNSLAHWKNGHGTENVDSEKEVVQKYLQYSKEGGYESLHAWVFEPSTFKNIFTILYVNKIIPLRLLRCYNTPYGLGEFCTIFVK